MLSVIIIARNEAHNIRRCLESIRWADEIIVLDSGSTDETIAIAKEYTQHVYSTDWQGYGVQKQRALEHATKEWVLNLDADESVDISLKLAIQKAISDHHADAYRVPIRMCFYNKTMRFSSSPARHIRLFKREGAQFSQDIVHEKILLSAHPRIAKLTNPILHHSFKDVSHALTKLNRYSSYSAKIRTRKHHSKSLMMSIFGAWWMFLRCYFFQRGFLDGQLGFILAVLNAQGSFYRGIKQLYPDHNIKELPN